MYKSIQRKEQSLPATLIQPSLEIGEEGDEYEQEANAVADTIMRMPEQSSGSGKAGSMHTGVPALQKMSGAEPGGLMAPPSVEKGIHAAKGGGSKLSPDVGQEMSDRIGADFSDVNIHTDSNAVSMNKEIGAKAFTHGNDIFFNQGQYNPSSGTGKHLLAHELTHTVQQGGDVKRKIQRQTGKGKAQAAGKGLGKTTTTAGNQTSSQTDIYVKTVDTLKPTYSPKGKFAWGINWVTNAKNGWIIQKIENSFNFTDCNGNKLAIYDDPLLRTYWEAWEVKDGKVIDGDQKRGHDLWGQGEVGMEILNIQKNKDYKGYWSTKGKVYFETSINKSIWKRKPELGYLYYTASDPGLKSAVELNRYAGGSLSTCGAESTWYHNKK